MGVHYERARLLFRQGRYDLAERELRDELAETPHDGQTHSFLGRCLARRNLLKEAQEECEEGVRLSPELPYAHYMLALTCIDANRTKEAEAAIGEALRLDPRNPEMLSWLAWLQFQRGDRRGALDTADEGLAIDPEHVTCLNRRGYFLRWMGDWKGSEVAVRSALALGPEDAYTHTNLAWTLWNKTFALARIGGFFQSWAASRRPELGEALGHFREALRLDPTSDWARTGVAEVLLTRNRAIFRMLVAVVGAAVVGALLLTSYAQPPADSGVIMGLFLAALGVLTVAFADGPAYLMMRRDRTALAVLSPSRLRAATATTICLLSAFLFAAAALGAPLAACGVVFLSLALVRPLSAACEASPRWPRRLLIAYAAAMGVVGLLLVAAMLGDLREPSKIAAAMALAVCGAVASLRSGQFARHLETRFAKKAG